MFSAKASRQTKKSRSANQSNPSEFIIFKFLSIFNLHSIFFPPRHSIEIKNRKYKSAKFESEDFKWICANIFLYFGRWPCIEEVIRGRNVESLNPLLKQLHFCSSNRALERNIKRFQTYMMRRWDKIESFYPQIEEFFIEENMAKEDLITQFRSKIILFQGAEYKFTPLVKIAFGCIYVIEAINDQQSFILKIVSRDEANDEIKIMEKCSHENIVKLYHYEDFDRFVFILMENCGVSMKNMLGGYGSNFGDDDLLRWIEEALDALSFLEQKGIVHGDIKPDNLTIDTDGCLKFIDFGAAFYLSESDHGCYTADYCAPEYWITEERDLKYDVWATAATFYSLIYKDLPWENIDDEHQTASAIIETPLHFETANHTVNEILNYMAESNVTKRLSATEIKNLYFK